MKKIATVLTALMMALLPLASQGSPENDLKEFRAYFAKKFPDVPMSDFVNGVYAVDKATGEQLGKVEAPASSSYGMMTYLHKGRQYIILQTGPTLTAMALADF